jgi:hypothetical protein
MKKLIIVLSLFLVGCTSNLSITESTISCISPISGQYAYGKDFDSTNCESVIAFLTKVVNVEESTVVKIVWEYNENIILEEEKTVSSSEYVNSAFIEPSLGYLKGPYKIKVYLNGTYIDSFDFSVK